MTAPELFLAMVVAAFATFIGALGFVSLWSRLAGRA
jgi:hypothetical protein